MTDNKKDSHLPSLSRRDFLKLTSATLGGIVGKSLYDKYLEKQVDDLQTPNPDFLADWNAGWSDYISTSYKNLGKSVVELEFNGKEGKAEEQKKLVSAWLIFHGLELYLSNTNGDMALDVLKKYRGCDGTPYDIYANNKLSVEREYAVDVYLPNILGANIFANGESKNWLRQDDNSDVLFWRQCLFNACDGATAQDAMESFLLILNQEPRPFKFWFGVTEARNLSVVLGTNTNWHMDFDNHLVNDDFLKDQCVFTNDENTLSIQIPSRIVKSIRFDGMFGSDSYPLRDLPFFAEDLMKHTKEMIKVLQSRGGMILPGFKDAVDALDSKDPSAFFNFGYRYGLLTKVRGEILYEKNLGETRQYDNKLFYFTKNFFEIFERYNLAKPFKISGAVVPRQSLLAQQGYVNQDGTQLIIVNDYGYFRVPHDDGEKKMKPSGIT